MLAVMCGRFTQARSWSELVQLYDITKGPAPSNFAPRYNIAPTQDIAVVRRRPMPARPAGAIVNW
jgi:putative SOS response-associated peptidase YedK